MKVGPEYITSKEKRLLDLSVANSLRPINAAAIEIAKAKFIPESHPPIAKALRAGVGEEPFWINKIRTTDPKTGDLYAHPLASRYRGMGIDEMAQIQQIFDGYMSMIGRRALAPQDQAIFYEKASHDAEGSSLVDKHRSIVAIARPGIVSTLGINRHADELLTPDECLAMDIEDFETASLTNDLAIMAKYLRKALELKLQNGGTHN